MGDDPPDAMFLKNDSVGKILSVNKTAAARGYDDDNYKKLFCPEPQSF